MTRRSVRLLLLLGPGMVLVMLPFLLGILILAGYSVQALGDTGGEGPGFALWRGFLGDPFTWTVVGTSVRLGATVTAATVLLAFPVACALARLRNPAVAAVAYVVLFSPMLMSVVVRSYGWLLLLSDRGFVNSLLSLAGLGPFRLVYNEVGVVIALVHILLPFAVLPLVSVVLQIPPTFREAALDMGAGGFTVFRRVTLPLALPGLVVAAEIVFALAVSSFVSPSVLGGGRVLVLSRLVYDNIGNVQWGLAAVQAVLLLSLAVAVLLVLNAVNRTTFAGRDA